MNAQLQGLAAELADAADLRMRMNVPLASMGRWRIGGAADLVLTPLSVDAVRRAMDALRRHGCPYVVVGDGSNILFDDNGLRGVILHIGRALDRFEITGDGHVRAGAGLWVPSFVRRVIESGLSGCVHAIGIPGALGGLVTMNGGSQRRGIGEQLVEAVVVDRYGERRVLSHAECGFAYRTSNLQKPGQVVVEASFRYEPSDQRALRSEALGILADRRRKFPKHLPNCGSVFVSNPALYASVGPPGRAIEEVGLKGLACGGAQISAQHANFFVNNGGARSAEILALILTAREAVAARTGIFIESEVRHLAPDGQMRMAHEAAELLRDMLPCKFDNLRDDRTEKDQVIASA